MGIVTKTVLDVLASKLTLCLLLFIWLIHTIFTFLVIPPGDDLGVYFTPALGIKNLFQNGMFIGEEFTHQYFMHPGFAFFHGLFFKLFSLVNIPINYYTYRLPQILFVLMLLLGTVYLINLCHRNNKTNYLIQSNIFLIILAITPFAQNCWYVRPDVLGLFFIVIGLICYKYQQNSDPDLNILYYASALFLGFAATVHLNFIIVVSPVVIIILIYDFMRNKNHMESFLFLFLFGFPSLVIVWWYYIHYPESVRELFNVLAMKSTVSIGYGAGLLRLAQEALMLGNWDTIDKKLYYAFFTMPLFLILVGSSIFVSNYLKMIRTNHFNFILFTLYLTSILILIADRRGWYNYFTITAYFALLFVTTVITSKHQITKSNYPKNGLLHKLILGLLIILASTEFIVHGAKYMLSSKKYFYTPRVYSEVSKELKQGDTIFINTNKFIAPFSGIFDDQYGDKADINVYHVFPFSYLANIQNKMRMFLINKVKVLSPVKTVWAYTKNGINFNRNKMEIRSSIRTTDFKLTKRLFVDIKVKDIIYEDNYYLVIRPESTKIIIPPPDIEME